MVETTSVLQMVETKRTHFTRKKNWSLLTPIFFIFKK